MKYLKFLLVSLVAVLGVLFLFLYFSNAYVLPWEKDEVIQSTLEMGGLNSLPENTEIISIEKRGSIFTRQFILEFQLKDTLEMNTWINQSKRLKGSTPKTENKLKVYEIYHGEGGAYGGKVKIDGTKAIIDMSWS